MRIDHKVNHGWAPPADNDPAWERRVEREAALITDATERAWRAAQKRLAKAEERRNRVAAQVGVTPQRLALAEQDVAERLEQLRAIERLMTSHAAPSKNRGRKSWRPVPYTDGGLV